MERNLITMLNSIKISLRNKTFCNIICQYYRTLNSLLTSRLQTNRELGLSAAFQVVVNGDFFRAMLTQTSCPKDGCVR